jgi:hypothetical protein
MAEGEAGWVWGHVKLRSPATSADPFLAGGDFGSSTRSDSQLAEPCKDSERGHD